MRMSEALFVATLSLYLLLSTAKCHNVLLLANLPRQAATQVEDPEASPTADVSTSIYLHAVSIRQEL